MMRGRGRAHVSGACLLLALCALAACSDVRGDVGVRTVAQHDSSAAATPVLVFAAADLRDALADVARSYRTAGGDSLVLVFGSTGEMTAQIRNGAPADLFFAANAGPMDELSGQGRIIDSTRALYAIGRLAVIARCARDVRDARPAACPRLTLADLAGAGIRTIAIADPSHAPYGLAAKQALERAGLWTRVQPRLVLGANISQAEQFVATGNADAGIVALSLVLRQPERAYTLVDPALHDTLRQTVAVVSGSPRVAAAVRFLRYLRSEPGTTVMQRYGFVVPGAASGAPVNAPR